MERCDEGAVNLSSGRETTERSSMKDEEVKGHSPLCQEAEDKSPAHRVLSSLSPTPNSPTSSQSAAKRKVKSNSAIELNSGSQQPLMMMAAQHGLLPQHMQQLLQQQNQGLSAQQQMMQHQTAMLQHQQQKLQEHILQELNEQLQLNVIQ